MRYLRVIGAVWFVTLGALSLTQTSGAASNMSYGITVGQALPPTATPVRVGRETFHVYHGSFYRQLKGGYILVPAPVGATIKALPRGAVKFNIGKAVYYRHAGVTYKSAGRSYQVCVPPAAEGNGQVGTDAHIAVKLGDEAFVFRKGRFFLESPEGLLGRSTPVGAIARDFPPDAMSVWFRDSEYFEASGVFFQEVEGVFKVVLPPWQATTVVSTEALAQASAN